MRIASFNVKNMLDRASAMRSDDWEKAGPIQKIDYILLSSPLINSVTTGAILRTGAWDWKNGDMWSGSSLKSTLQAANDHCAIYADLNL